MNRDASITKFGVMLELPPQLLYAGAVWVCVADGIFLALWLLSTYVPTLGCLAAGAALPALLILVSQSRAISTSLSLVSACIYGALVFSFSGIAGLSILVAGQVGLMHYCAFRILAQGRRSKRLERASPDENRI
jgi:hypothetical protein